MKINDDIYSKALEQDKIRDDRFKKWLIESNKMEVCLRNGICPNCGSRLRWRKVGFFNGFFLGTGGNDMMHECISCGWSRGDAHADAT